MCVHMTVILCTMCAHVCVRVLRENSRKTSNHLSGNNTELLLVFRSQIQKQKIREDVVKHVTVIWHSTHKDLKVSLLH